MERNYKPNKNTKLQNLFLCQKQIQKLKSKLLNLIQSPCPTFQQLKKTSIIIEVNHKPRSTSRKKNDSKKSKPNEYSPAKLTKQNCSPKSKKTLCPCNSYWIQSGTKKKKLFMSQSPKKTNKSKSKAYIKPKNQSESLQKIQKLKPLRSESTAQNNNDSAMRTPKQILKGGKIEQIKKTKSVTYSFEDSMISSTPQSKKKGNQIKIEHEESFIKNFSEVKKGSNVQEKQSYVSPLNSKYFRAHQQSRIMNEENSRVQNGSPSNINFESQQAFYLDEESSRSRIKTSRQSQNEFMSTGMTEARHQIISPNKINHPQRQVMTSRTKYYPLETDLNLDLLKDICQKTERFVTEEIYPFRQVLCKTQRSTIENKKIPSDTKLMNKISNFSLWINNNETQHDSP